MPDLFRVLRGRIDARRREAARSFIVYPGEETCPLGDEITGTPLPALMRRLVEARSRHCACGAPW